MNRFKKPILILCFFSYIIEMIHAIPQYTNLYIAPYALIFLTGAIAIYYNHINNISISHNKTLVGIVSFFLGGASLLACDYQFILSFPSTTVYDLIRLILCIIGAGYGIYNIFALLLARLTIGGFNGLEDTADNKKLLKKIFLASFGIICLIDMLVLFLGYYPGTLSGDSAYQVWMIMNEEYSNHHPFYHTMLFKLFLGIGRGIFGSMNAGVACYCLMQIILVSLAFSYIVMSIYEISGNRIVSIIVWVYYALFPVNIMYSFFISKDVIFAISVSVFIVTVLRILVSKGNDRFNYIMIAVSGLGFGIFRSNGLIALLVTFIAFIFLLGKDYKKLLIELLIIIVASAILKGPVLKVLDVSQPDIVESLSIPIQQIGRVLSNEQTLSDEQLELLGKIIDTDKIAESYDPYVSDNLKMMVRNYGNLSYLEEHKAEYLKLWIDIGISQPKSYLAGWIDQTKGYWNGSGFYYWICLWGVRDNDFGIERKVVLTPVHDFMEEIVHLLEKPSGIPFLNILVSVGLSSWIVVAFITMALCKKDKRYASLGIPIFALVATLLIATPVYCEFRYAYSSFTTLPILLACLRKARGEGIE